MIDLTLYEQAYDDLIDETVDISDVMYKCLKHIAISDKDIPITETEYLEWKDEEGFLITIDNKGRCFVDPLTYYECAKRKQQRILSEKRRTKKENALRCKSTSTYINKCST